MAAKPDTRTVMGYVRRWHDTPNDTTLADLASALDRYYEPLPDHLCFRCGKSDTENEQDGYGSLVDVTVLVANGEEGQAMVTHYVCQDHLVEVTDQLIDLGFGQHRHGGANFLEPRDCPGYERMADCPTPASEDDE